MGAPERPHRGLLTGLVALGCGVAAWEGAVWALRLPAYLFPGPGAVFRRLVAGAEEIAPHFLTTAAEVGSGFLLSAIVGTALGVAVGYWPRLGDAAYPLLVTAHSLPKVALAPLLVLWLGYGLMPKLAVIALAAIFPIAIGTAAGMRGLDPLWVDLFRSWGARESRIFWKLRLPHAAPALFAALKVGAAAAVVGAVVGEFVAASGGLGYLQLAAASNLDGPLVLATVLLMGFLGLAAYVLVDGIESRLFPWGRGHAVPRVRKPGGGAQVVPMPRRTAGAPRPGEPGLGVEVSHLTVDFPGAGGPVRALEDLSFRVEPGEFVAIVGPSGCGKSTLLGAIAALRRPRLGEVWVDGQHVTAPRTDVGMVFQQDLLLRWRTVLENVTLPDEARGLPPRREEARWLLGQVGLAGYEDCYPDALSGGMRQRVAVCRALLHEHGLLLMDEPFASLDALTREQLNLDLLAVWEARRMTVLLVTHSIEEAVFLADRVLVLSSRPGRLVAEIRVGLPRPRTLAHRSSARLTAVAARIRHLLAQEGVLRQA